MKVLHILYALQPSGMETMLHASADLWRARGVEAHILANDDSEGPFADALRIRGYVVHRIPWSRWLRHLGPCWRLFRRERYDAVHIHTYRGYLGLAVTARLAGIRHIVRTIHNVFYAGGRARRNLQILRRRAAKRLGVRFVSVGRSVQDNERRVYGLDTELIWNWTDAVRFARITEAERAQSRATLGLAPDNFVLVSIGNCSGEAARRAKNHRLILEGLANLPPELRARSVYLHVGREDDARSERRLAADLRVEANTRFLGPQADVRGFLAAADLYVMPSLHEGLSVAAIEAATCGMPLLLTDVPGLRDFKDVLQDGVIQTGLGAQDMAAAMARFAGMPPEARTAVGDRCRRLAEETFSMEKGVARYLALYGGRA